MPLTQTGAEDVERRLGDVASRLRDLTPALQIAGADTVTLVSDAFASERSPDGTPWAPLSETTLARRRGSTASILTDTARLRNSVTFSTQPRSLRFGTNVGYGRSHQWGATIRPWGRGSPRALTPRPFLPVTGSSSAPTLMTTGPAGAHWDRVRANVRHYILTGELR